MSVDLCVRIIVRPYASLHLRTFGGHTHTSSVCEQGVGGGISFYVSVSSCLYDMPSSHCQIWGGLLCQSLQLALILG